MTTMGLVESKIRSAYKPPVVLYTLAQHSPFGLTQIDDHGIVLKLGHTRAHTPISWSCLEGIPDFLRGARLGSSGWSAERWR